MKQTEVSALLKKLTLHTLLLSLTLKVTAQTDTVLLHEVLVTSTRTPIVYQDAARLVTVITAKDIEKLPTTSLNELLENVLGVDSRQRGVHGIQSDLSLRGGNFEQTLILINGQKINDPQTGHHSMNIPVELSEIERIEVLHGPGARVFGGNAFAGVINIITTQPKRNQATVHLSAGQYGLLNSGAQVSAKKGNFQGSAAFNHKSSEGYTENTDFAINNVFIQSGYQHQLLEVYLMGGYTDKSFGAQSFYTPKFPNQFEDIRVKLAGFELSYGQQTKISVRGMIRRHHDRFELFRDSAPTWYQGHNYHMTDVYSMDANLSHKWKSFTTSIGAEFRNESILSNVLGTDLSSPRPVPREPNGIFTKSASRSIGSIFLEQMFHKNRLFFSGGALLNYYSDYNNQTFLGLDGALKITEPISVYCSVNQSLRLPSYTELYYKSPTNLNNTNLKPEKALTTEIGIKYQTLPMQTSVSVFHRWGTDIIDWVKTSPTESVWQTVNFTKINTLGTEFTTQINLKSMIEYQPFNNLTISYAWIESSKYSENYISYYALDYLKHNLSASISGKIFNSMGFAFQANYRHRAGTYTLWNFETNSPIDEKSYKPFTTFDIKLNYTWKQFEIFGQINNLTNVTVIDYGNIPQPGRWIQAVMRIR
ncbi:MAG TPA: TonB-dependent receptor, partial [Salinivirgaceae bacterium]|nr:TonB-dependent receptor [Salinivirgaceae bacterium]